MEYRSGVLSVARGGIIISRIVTVLVPLNVVCAKPRRDASNYMRARVIPRVADNISIAFANNRATKHRPKIYNARVASKCNYQRGLGIMVLFAFTALKFQS